MAILPTGSLLAQTSVEPEFGTGSTADPYQIATLNNLYWLSQERSVWDRHFVLTANIDARSTETWDEGRGFSPIGFCEGFYEPPHMHTDCDDYPQLTSNPFTGAFDGQSFTISGLTIDRQTMNSVGLFGHGSGSNVVIKNLRLEQVNITGFENVGGVVGTLRLGRLENVSATGNVTAIRHKAGGLMGIGNNAVLTDRNVFLGTVTARNEAGGLVGRAREATAVSLSYARGNIVETAGDLSGRLGGAGGLVGNSGNRSDFRNLYFAGTVTSPGKANAIAGNYNSSDDFRNVYWDADLFPGDPAAAGGIATQINLAGLTTGQMQDSSAQSNMLFDNFTDSWQVIASPQDGYPVFNWQSGNPVPVVSGTLFDQSNQPLGGGITVRAIPNSAFFDVEQTTTNANGEYAFTDVIFDAPDYTMAASTIVNSRTISANVSFDPSTTSTVDLMLTPNVEVTDISAVNTAGTTIAITVTATEPLSGLLVAVTGPSASNLFLENGFAETANGDGTFSYSRDYEAPQDGAFTFTVDEAIGENGANGAQGEFTTVGINSFVVTTVAVNGSITSPRNPGLNVNETTTVTGTADSDFFFSSVSGCGGTAQSNSDQAVTSFSYTTGPVSEDCTVTATFSFLIDGDGTPGDRYQITSWAQLDSVRNELDAHYLLLNTLDSNSSGYSTYNTDEGWAPIGTPGNPFTGSFDGDGFAINGLFIAGDHPAYGLFGATGAGASLTALTMTGVSISSQQNAQIGPFGVLVGANAGTVNGVALDNGTVSGLPGADVGGLVGTNVGMIANSSSNIAVFGGGMGALGGLVGATTGGTITDSRSSGGVSVDGGALEPGIFFGSNDATALTRSHATAIVLDLTQQPVVEANAAPLATQPAIEAVDSHGLRDLTLGAAQTVLAEIGSGAGATLGGTTTIALEDGLASYDNLSFTGDSGVEYTLVFSSAGLGGVTSDTFQLLTVGGEVSGLVGNQVVLQNNGGDDLAINSNGSFNFPAQAEDTDYNVTVATQPGNPIQTCSVANATGTLTGANVSNVDVTCVTHQFTVGGNVSGLTGDQVVLQNNGGDDIAINADGGFTFTAQNDGTDYNVTVATQPGNPSQTCSVANASGTLIGANVSNVDVTCTIDQFSVGGEVSALTGDQVVLQNNGGDEQVVVTDGGFTFTTQDDGTNYNVTVATQPSDPSQICTVANGNGTLAGADVTNVEVTCTTEQFTVGGTVTGLEGDQVVLQNNGGDDQVVIADGGFTFTTQDDGTDYNVTVATQPSDPSQTCTVANGDGTLAGADVSNVEVTCTTEQFTVGGTVTGLEGDQVVLQNNGGDEQVVVTDGGFTFTAQDDGTDYNVTVATQPNDPSQTCTVANGSGSLASSDVTNVEVTCTTDQFTISGTISGLEGDQVVLQKNGGDDQVVTADGGVTFAAQDDGTAYEVTVLTQPVSPIQTCAVSNGSGKLAGSDITDIQVQCSTEPSAMTLSANNLDFGFVLTGEQTSQLVTLTNSGTGELEIDQISDPALPFTLNGGSCLTLPLVLASSESCEIKITFESDAGSAGENSSSIDIVSNADSSPDTISLRGTSVVPAPVPALGPFGLIILVLMLAGLAWRRSSLT